MFKRFFLVIQLSIALVATAHSQIKISNAFGQLGIFYNTNDHSFALREHSIWLQSAVGMSLGKHFELGLKMNQYFRYGRQPYFDFLWDAGPFVRAKWNLKEYTHFYAELGLQGGNICPCGGIGAEYIIKQSGTYHISFTDGVVLKLKSQTYLFAEFYWNFTLERETADFGYINAYIGIRQYLRRDYH
ncbi:MAG: hypothetical protein AAF927_33960 [Bacteroidota bacterium]